MTEEYQSGKEIKTDAYKSVSVEVVDTNPEIVLEVRIAEFFNRGLGLELNSSLREISKKRKG